VQVVVIVIDGANVKMDHTCQTWRKDVTAEEIAKQNLHAIENVEA